MNALNKILLEAAEYPSVLPMLRWQVRVPSTRPAVYTRKKYHRYPNDGCPPMVGIDKLLGFGETKAAAEEMARKAKW